MSRRVSRLAVLASLLLVPAAAAEICTIDAVPAATLLLPYFEVDITDGFDALTTLFTINNASANPALAHVTVWSDQSVPVLDFDVYLTGYDVQTINMRDFFLLGNLPPTADDARDPADTISPQGPVSQDATFPGCGSVLPYVNPAISLSFRAHLKAWLQGAQSPATGNCAGARIQDGLVRGYVTIDSVTTCNLLFPASPGYFAGTADNRNILWGDYFFVDIQENFAQGFPLVHIEADPTAFVPGDHTFYGRYVAGNASDAREPLPTTHASSYLVGGAFDGGTDLLIWREANASAVGYNCVLPGPTSWYPLELFQAVIFDDQQQPVQTDTCPSGDPTCEQDIQIPNEAQRVDVVTDLLAPFDLGWIYLNLQHPAVVPIYGDDDAQSWVTTMLDAQGRFSVGFQAVQLDSGCAATTAIIPVP